MLKEIFEKRHNSERKGRIKRIQSKAQLHTMGENPRRFQNCPLKTVGGDMFTRIC